MVSKESTTRKWVAKFCELMDWFIGLEKVHGGNLGTAHAKGLAANYLAAKLGLFDKEPPFRSNEWQCDFPEQPSCRQRMEFRRERMEQWKQKAKQRGAFETVALSPEVTPERVQSYCSCLEDIIYRAHDWTLPAEVAALGRKANDLAVKLGLTHPDWLLAMDLGLLMFVQTEEIRELPLPWDYDKPPVVLRNPPRVVHDSDVPRLRESIKKAEALLVVEPPDEDSAPTLQDLKDPVRCKAVGEIARTRSDNVARMLRSRRYPVVTVGRKNYCDAEDAAVLWPKWKKYWRAKKKNEES